MSRCNSIVGLYFKGTCDVISVTIARSTKAASKFQTISVTYHFYFFVGKFPKFFNFSDSMEKIYLVELNIFKENAFSR